MNFPEIQNFIGREKELNLINKYLSLNTHPILIYGSPGIGKSYLVKKVAEIYQNEYEEVIFISGSSIYSPSDVYYFIGKHLNLINVDKNEIINFLHSRKILVIFDGLDELFPDSINEFVKEISPLLIKRSKMSIIMTTRSLHYDILHIEYESIIILNTI